MHPRIKSALRADETEHTRGLVWTPAMDQSQPLNPTSKSPLPILDATIRIRLLKFSIEHFVNR